MTDFLTEVSLYKTSFKTKVLDSFLVISGEIAAVTTRVQQLDMVATVYKQNIQQVVNDKAYVKANQHKFLISAELLMQFFICQQYCCYL